MRRKKTIYIATCDSCHREIKGVVYQGKNIEGKMEDLCKACYVTHSGSTWQYIWFKIHNWVYVIGALAVAYLIYQIEGNDVYVFWAALATIGLVYLVLKEQKFIAEQTRRRVQDKEYEEENKGRND